MSTMTAPSRAAVTSAAMADERVDDREPDGGLHGVGQQTGGLAGRLAAGGRRGRERAGGARRRTR